MKVSIKKLVYNNSMYKKLVIYFSIIIFVSVILLSGLLYYNYSRSTIKIYSSLNHKLLSQISYSSVYMDDMAKNFCKSLYLDNTVKAFLYSKENDIIITGNAIRTTQALTVPNAYIHSVYVYNSNLDLFFSTKNGGFYNSSEFYDPEIANLIKQRAPSLSPIPRKISSDSVYTYIMYDSFKEKTNTIILNVNTDWLKETIQSLQTKSDLKDSSILVLNQDGIIINHSKSNMFMQNYSDESYLNKVLSTTDYGTFIDYIDNTKHMISFVGSDDLNWKFVSLVPYELVFNTYKKIKSITALFCIFVLLLGYIFTRFASKKLYNPIKNLISGLESNSNFSYSNYESGDEIAFLSTSLNKICTKANQLKKNTYLKSLLGITNYLMEQDNNIPETVSITINPNKCMSLFILKLDHQKQFLDQTDEKQRTSCNCAIIEIIKNTISPYFTHEIIDSGYDHFAVIINIEKPNEEELKRVYIIIIESIQNLVSKELKMSLSATYGYIINDITSLQSLYHDVLDASMYRIKLGYQSIISTDILDSILTTNVNLEYSSSEEIKLLNSLKLGKLEEATKAYYNIINVISEYSYDCIISSIIYLNFNIYNTLASIKTINEINYLNEYKKFFENLWNHETLDDINMEFIHFMKLIISNINKPKKSKSNIVINNMLSIMNEKYSDKNLCLNYIADQLDMSPIYIGRLFKSSTKKSVSKYIMDLRMDNMKQLLDTSQLSLTEILDQSGIENNNYFYTIFKKYFGVSLSQYKSTLSKERIERLISSEE